jgi:hypothetical protein
MTDQTARYRHRTPEVEAVQWTGSNADALRAFCGPDFDEIELDDRAEDPDETAAVREGRHGTWRGLKPGDWVVKLDGGLCEFAAADFAEQYEPAVPAPATDRDTLIEIVAQAIWARTPDAEPSRTGLVMGNPHGIAADVVAALAALLPASTDRGAVLEEAADRLGELRIAEREWLVACGLDKGEQELRRVADETRNTTEALRPATTEWTFEACYDADNDKWHGIGGTYSDHAEAKDAFKRRAENDPDHVKHFKFRLVRATTTYTVEAEHTPPATPPAGGAQQPKETRP